MKNQDYSQLELFSSSKDYSGIKTQTPRRLFFGRIRNYEKKILITIAFVITGIVSFSLGVEKGKRTQLSKATFHMDMARKSEPAPEVNKQTYQTPAPAADNKQIKNLHNYTVQVASFKNRSLAEKETERLKKMGYEPLLFPKGNFVIVCVGNFNDKKIAQNMQSKLKKRYGDCIIRRL